MIEIFLAASIGLGLASACGFRVFVPMLVIGLAGRGDYLTLADGFGWLESWPAIGAMGVATAVEIGAYYFPWLDNLLDTISTPAAVVAGIVVSTAVAHEDMNPFLRWSLGIIAGGGTAGIVKVGFAAIRAGSSVTTAGIGNPIVSTFEWIGSIVMSLLAIFLPIIAGILAIVAVIVVTHFGSSPLEGLAGPKIHGNGNACNVAFEASQAALLIVVAVALVGHVRKRLHRIHNRVVRPPAIQLALPQVD